MNVVEVIVWLIESSSVICRKQAESIKLLCQFLEHGKRKIITENVNYCVFITSESICHDTDFRRTKHACFCHILKIVWRQSRDRKYVASVDSNFVSSLPT